MTCPVMQPIFLVEDSCAIVLRARKQDESPVNQAVVCSGEHVYRGAAMAFVGDINGAYLLSIVP
jgi:hypothetical protein